MRVVTYFHGKITIFLAKNGYNWKPKNSVFSREKTDTRIEEKDRKNQNRIVRSENSSLDIQSYCKHVLFWKRVVILWVNWDQFPKRYFFSIKSIINETRKAKSTSKSSKSQNTENFFCRHRIIESTSFYSDIVVVSNVHFPTY